MRNKIDFILGSIALLFFGLVWIIIILSRLFYGLFDNNFVILITLFFTLVVVFYIFNIFKNKIVEVRLDENEELMRLRMDRNLSGSLFFYSAGIALLIYSMPNLLENFRTTVISIFVFMLAAVFWYLGYMPRHYKLEKLYSGK